MAIRRWLWAVAICVVAGAATLEALQHLVPRIPPREAGLPPVYEMLDLGAAPAVTCSCVPNPFTLPKYRPGWAYGAGPAVPLDDPPITEADRRLNAEWYAQEGANLRTMMSNGENGNYADSFGVATHLGLHRFVIGPDDRVEQEAVRWLTMAAEQGHPDAARLLALRYLRGAGVAQDEGRAAAWFDRAARHDDPISMTAIGLLYAAGRGVEQSWTSAIWWWQRAEGRTPFASRFLGDAYACGAGVREDRERAIAAYKKAAALEPSSSIQLGHIYARGCAGPDDNSAVSAFRRAAEQGFPEAQLELSALLLEGRTVEGEPLEAYRWARIAERRLPAGTLKQRAADLVAAAARLVPAVVIASEDRMIDQMIGTSAKPMR
jgi:TPR repeat protein